MSTPPFTRTALAATVAILVAALAAFLAGRDGEIESRFTGWFLLLFTLLFAARVAGQLLVVLRAPRWLPPMESGQWNLMPYRLLLPIQLVFLAVMGWIVASFLTESGPPTEPAPAFGWFVIGFSLVYAGAMAVRYVLRMRRHPGQRWFGGAIPIVFHWVLAGFLFVFGSYHASH
jgi:uncharacterized protein